MANIKDPTHFGKLTKAIAAFEAQEFDLAEKELRSFLKKEPSHAKAVDIMVRILLQKSDFAGARDVLLAFVHEETSAHYAFYMLGTIFEHMEDYEQAASHFAKALILNRNEPLYFLYLGAALEQVGHHDEAVQVFSLGTELDDNLRHLHRDPQAAPQLRDRSAMADAAIRGKLTSLHTESVAKISEELGADVSRILAAVWPQTHTGAIHYENEKQRPSIFYVPKLRDQAIFDGNDYPWVQGLEKSFDSIRREVEAELDTARDGEAHVAAASYVPVDWAPLKGSMNWTSVHLFRDGEKIASADRFPKTIAALKRCPLVTTNGQPFSAYFSILRSHTQVPPYFGQTNYKLNVHLPIFVPKLCSIRVDNHEHKWKAGKAFLFDDSFEHELKNKGEGTLTILTFEVWHPELNEAEKKAIEQSFADRIAWHNSRFIPDRFHPKA